MAYEICDYCKQHINVDHTSYDILKDVKGNQVYLHHNSCVRLYLMNRQAQHLATHLRGKHVPRT